MTSWVTLDSDKSTQHARAFCVEGRLTINLLFSVGTSPYNDRIKLNKLYHVYVTLQHIQHSKSVVFAHFHLIILKFVRWVFNFSHLYPNSSSL
jgi:hypothetical protein